MILTSYLIDALSTLSILVGFISLFASAMSFFAAFIEAIGGKSHKKKMTYYILLAFFCLIVFSAMPNKEVISYLIAG